MFSELNYGSDSPQKLVGSMADEHKLLEHYQRLMSGHRVEKECADDIGALIPPWVTSLSKMCLVDGQPAHPAPYFEVAQWP